MTDITPPAHATAATDPNAAGLDPRVARSRNKMLAAATELLVEAGPRNVTVDAVSERSGVAKSTLYRHWPSRTDLLVDVLRCNIPDVDEVDLSHGFEAALRQHFDDVARTFSDPKWSKMLPGLFMLRSQFQEVAEITQVDREQKNSVLRAIFEVGVAEGRVPPDLDPTTAAATLFGPMLFATMTGEGDLGEIGRFAIDCFLDSLAARH